MRASRRSITRSRGHSLGWLSMVIVIVLGCASLGERRLLSCPGSAYDTLKLAKRLALDT
jgi:uncharacterized protein (DUF2252 family)